jgi:hypothetical protein
MNQSITPADAVKFLNQLTRTDPMAMHGLIVSHTICNRQMADREDVHVKNHMNRIDFVVGPLNILNGLFGTIEEGKHKGAGPITAIFNEATGRLLGFCLTEGL